MERNPREKMSLHDAFMYLKDHLTDEWRDVGRHLGLSEGDMNHICSDYRGNSREITYQMLLKWKSKNGREATLTVLAEALKSSGKRDLADALIKGENSAKFSNKTPDTAENTQNIPEANQREANHPGRPATYFIMFVSICIGVAAFKILDGNYGVNESKPHIRDEILKPTDAMMEPDIMKEAISYVKSTLTQEWQDVARNLGLSHPDIEHIKEQHDNNPKERNYQMLQKWREQYGMQATLEALEDALRKAGRRDLAEKLPKGKEKRTKR